MQTRNIKLIVFLLLAGFILLFSACFVLTNAEENTEKEMFTVTYHCIDICKNKEIKTVTKKFPKGSNLRSIQIYPDVSLKGYSQERKMSTIFTDETLEKDMVIPVNFYENHKFTVKYRDRKGNKVYDDVVFDSNGYSEIKFFKKGDDTTLSQLGGISILPAPEDMYGYTTGNGYPAAKKIDMKGGKFVKDSKMRYQDSDGEITIEVPSKFMNNNYTLKGKNFGASVGLNLTNEDAKLGIENIKELPEGTTYSFKRKVSIEKVGKVNATVVATYPDKTTDEVDIVINVIGKENIKDSGELNKDNTNISSIPKTSDCMSNIGITLIVLTFSIAVLTLIRKSVAAKK